jgi:N-sulfoglucosamine sulfohydrolase
VGAPLALYDLERDPGERQNLLRAPAYRADVARLSAALLAHMERTGDPELPRFRALAAPP